MKPLSDRKPYVSCRYTSLVRHGGLKTMCYEPRTRGKLCPMKATVPEIGQDCVEYSCQWWMPVQKTCAVKVLAAAMGNQDWRAKRVYE